MKYFQVYNSHRCYIQQAALLNNDGLIVGLVKSPLTHELRRRISEQLSAHLRGPLMMMTNIQAANS